MSVEVTVASPVVETEVVKKPRAPRKPKSDIGNSFGGFVRTVVPNRLAALVGQKISDPDGEKVKLKINGLIRQVSQDNGVLPINQKEFAEIVIETVVELDADMEAKAKTLRKSLIFTNKITGTRDTTNNWISRLKAGIAISLKSGPEGPGMYVLAKVGEYDPTAATEEDCEGEFDAFDAPEDGSEVGDEA